MVDPSLKGRTFAPFSFTVERGKVREFLAAIGDDVAKAKQADAVVPPTFATTFLFWGGDGLEGTLKEMGVELFNVLHAEQEYQYFLPVKVGDTITGQIEVSDIYSKAAMTFVVLQMNYKNQRDENVIRETTTLIVRDGGAA